MKNTKGFAIIRRSLLILIALCLCLSGCGQNIDKPPVNDNAPERDKGIHVGISFTVGDWSLDFGDMHVGFKSEKSVFDINNVTLTIYYGDYFSSDLNWERENNWSYEYFELYFTNDDYDKILIRHVDENFVSEKYRCRYLINRDKGVGEIVYNSFEEFTVPKEIFTKDQGSFSFVVYGWGTKMREGVPRGDYQRRVITGNGLFYKKEGDKIILSANSFFDQTPGDVVDDKWDTEN